MHVALVALSPFIPANCFSGTLFPRSASLSTYFPSLFNRSTPNRLCKSSSRLRRLVPVVPTDDAEELHGSLFVDNQHHLIPAEFQERKNDPLVARIAADATSTASAPNNQQLPTDTELSQQPLPQQELPQQPQLQPYSTFADDWTASPDDEILSAAAHLPADSTLASPGFIGGRFTFGNQNALQQNPSAPQPAEENQHSESHDNALEQHMRDVEAELQQAVTYSGLNSSTSGSGGTYINADSWFAVGSRDSDTGNTVDDEQEDADAVSAGSYFRSRSNMLRQLQHQQVQVQRDHLLSKQRKNLYNYSLSDSGSIVRRSKPGPKHPLDQTSFALAKKQPVVDSALAASDDASSTDSFTSSSKNNLPATLPPPLPPPPPPQQQQQGLLAMQQKQQRMQQMLPMQDEQLSEPISSTVTSSANINSSSSGDTYSSSSSSGGTYSSSSRAWGAALKPVANAAAAAAGGDSDPSRGLCLSVFLYCCSQSKLLSLTWQLGLPPNAMRFVSRVADADVVLHVKPRPGEKHFHYEEYRDQAAKKGIPMVDLKNLSAAELQLYLLPVFRLYAGEIAPRDLLRRGKPRGWKKRYTNIKLPRV